MATVKALIRPNLVNSKGECTVYVRYGHQQKTVDISTQIKVNPEFWNIKKEIINRVSGIPKSKKNEEIIKIYTKLDIIDNTAIERTKSALLARANELKLLGINPDPKTIKTDFKESKSSAKKETQKEDGLIPSYTDYIKSINKSLGTKKNYSTTLHHLKEFESFRKKKLKVSDYTLDTNDELIHFLIHDFVKQDKSKGLVDNTIGTSIKNLKTFLRHLSKRGYELKIDPTEMKVFKQTKPIYFLTIEELDILSNYNFEAKRHERVRDLFVFNCYTGLRYSDLARLRQFHIIDDVIQMRAYKNQKDTYNPLIPKSKEILKKYDYQLPDISEQKFNKYIKEACEIAGINRLVEQIKTQSGNKTYDYNPIHQLISSHIAIKTFISICCEKGVSPKTVAEVTGKSLKVIIDHYYGVDKKTIKNQLINAFS